MKTNWSNIFNLSRIKSKILHEKPEDEEEEEDEEEVTETKSEAAS